MAFFQGSRGGNSRGNESNPIGSASLVSQEYQLPVDPVEIEDWSDKSESSPEESHKKDGRVYRGKEENLQFASAWLKCSNDPVLSIDKRGDRYWKDVEAETREAYKKVVKKKGPFALEYWWRAGKDQLKWTKAQLKGKGKSVYSEDNILNENVQDFNELQLRKAIAAEKMAEATLVNAEAKKIQAEANNKMVEAKKERARL
ncbi:hypothetical protein SETIT_2G327000v2 [Setaria italica]|uniref:No apical meristem-associated C-terminal domain-containing protein n=1 Tax=Setaria italica TaxID=4555 RepID=A0A368Q5B0_SETIT|nr:hypothetical protein SETIT_2G327000v2 [Setaria italica]